MLLEMDSSPKPKRLLDLPLELQCQIFEWLLPARKTQISLNEPLRTKGQALGKLSRGCKQLHIHIEEWLHVKDYFIKSRHFGLIDPDRTVFTIDINDLFRRRMEQEAVLNGLDSTHVASIVDRAADHAWWEWLALDGEEDTVRHLEKTLRQEDKFRLRKRYSDAANIIIFATMRCYLERLQGLEVFVGWEASIEAMQEEEVKFSESTNAMEGLPIAVGAWYSPRLLGPRPATKVWYQGLGPRTEAGLIYEWNGRPVHNRDASNR